MLREQMRIEESWSSGRRWSVDTSFVHGAYKNFKHPVIESLNFRMFGSVSTLGAFTLQNFAHCSVIGQSVKLSDPRGRRIDASFRGLRLIAQQEYGARLRDTADQAGTTTNTSFDTQLPVCHHPRRAERPNDYLMTVDEFMDCELIWNAATTNPVTASTQINSGTLQLQANIRENYTVDAPARQQIVEISAEKAEETFTVEGALRYALLYAHTSNNSDLTSLSTYTEVDSRTLRLTDQPSSALVQMAQLQHPNLDDTDDEVGRATVIPLVVPDFDQHFTQLVDHAGKLHIKLQAALPTGGKLLTVAVTPRDDAATAKVLGFASTAQLYAAIDAGLVGIVGSKGVKPISAGGLKMAQLAPLRRLDV